MYLSAERLALANRTIQETFEQTSIAWQSIAHWDTGDPGQTLVRNDVVNNPGFIPIELEYISFKVTLVQAQAPTPDPLLAEVIARTVDLAKAVDDRVIPALRNGSSWADLVLVGTKPQEILDQLLPARANVEDKGYRAPSCLITNTPGLIAVTQLVSGYSIADSLFTAATINSLHRASKVVNSAAANKKIRMVLLGRRQRIAHGGAPGASPGEEPVDLAVSVTPSLELVGEAPDSKVELAVRIRYALRIKDAGGIVVIKE